MTKDMDTEAEFFARGKRLAQQLDRGERPADSRVFTFEDPVERQAVQQIIEQVESLLKKSGTPDGFNASEWVANWLTRPCPALAGDRPINWLDMPDRRARVTQIISCIGSGAYL